MKTIPIALAANLGSGAATPAYALRVTRTDGQVFGFTSARRSVTISSVVYDAAQGLDASAIVASAGLDTDNLELTTLDDGTLFRHPDVVGGVWQGAAFLIFRYSWAAPADGVEPVMAGTFGNVSLRQGAVVVELRGLQQYLQQPVGNITSKTCRANFADHPRPNGNNRCGLAAADWSDSFTIETVASLRQFTVAGVATSADPDFNANGVLALFNGANGATTTTDSGPTPRTITLSGAATLTTAQQRFGTASLNVPGSGRATIQHGAKLDLATGDFTIQVSARLTSTASNGIALNKGIDTGNYQYQVWFNAATQKWGFRAITSGGTLAVDIAQSGTYSSGWVDIAVTRVGSTFTLRIDGTSNATATYSGALWSTTSPVEIGALGNGVAPITGQIDHLRITQAARSISALTEEFLTGELVSRLDEWFAEGLATFTSGDNSGRMARVRSWSGSTVTLKVDLPYLLAIGDSLDMLAGCRKRLDEDCATRFSNERRFQGEPHRPSIDTLTASPEPAA